jgi:hypothetical protein
MIALKVLAWFFVFFGLVAMIITEWKMDKAQSSKSELSTKELLKMIKEEHSSQTVMIMGFVWVVGLELES